MIMTTNRVPIFLAFVNKYKGKNKPEIWHIDEASKKMPIINPGSCKKHILGEKWYMRRASLTLNNLVFVLYYKYSHFATGILFILIVFCDILARHMEFITFLLLFSNQWRLENEIPRKPFRFSGDLRTN